MDKQACLARNPSAKTLSHLGLSMRAGKLTHGDEGVLKSVRSAQAKLVLIAADASDNTRKKFRDKCESYGVRYVVCGEKAELGASIGKEDRVVLAITDTGMAQMIINSLEFCTEVEHIGQTR